MLNEIGLYHRLDGVTKPKCKLFSFSTAVFCKEKKALAFTQERWCHLALCLWLIFLHYAECYAECRFAECRAAILWRNEINIIINYGDKYSLEKKLQKGIGNLLFICNLVNRG